MSFADSETLVGITDIAEMARAKRAAVSNWPKRYSDFPKPRTVTPSGALFDAREVERWLIVKGKIDGPIPPTVRLWKVVDRLRDVWSPGDITEFLAGCLVYLAAAPAESGEGVDWTMDISDTWPEIRTSKPADLLKTLLAAARRIEKRTPMIAGVMTRGLDRSPRADDSLLAEVLDLLYAASSEELLEDLLSEAVSRLMASDRSFGSHQTPSDLGELMIRLAFPISGTVFDPAMGMGNLLQLAALHPDSPSHPNELIGYDLSERVSRLAKAQCFLYGMMDPPNRIDIECRDTLREANTLDVKADIVLLDPPFGLRDWGDTDLYVDKQVWSFGLPSPRSADFAWVQLAINALKPDGRAIVVLPAGAASSGGRAERIRKNLVLAGCVEAVIFLPTRFRPETSVPLSLWILRRPLVERSDEVWGSKDVLLVDATGLGARRELGQWVNELGIDDIVTTVDSGVDLTIHPSIAIGVGPETIAEDGNLSFTHYQPLPSPPDLEGLDVEIASLRDSLDYNLQRLTEWVAELSRILKEPS
jgi:type I restriction-modification system DNA methylase subunit